MTCCNFLLCWCKVCEVYATCAYCRLFATSSQSWCAVPRECGTCWLYIYNLYLLTLPPIATPLEFSHQFYNCFDPKYRSFLKRSLCPSQVRAGYLSCPSKFFQSFVAIESIYLVYAQAHAERLLLCSTHALKIAMQVVTHFHLRQGHNDSFWEWAGCASTCGFLGSSWALFVENFNRRRKIRRSMVAFLCSPRWDVALQNILLFVFSVMFLGCICRQWEFAL